MTRVAIETGLECVVDDFLWPWETSTPVLLQHGIARNSQFWNKWVPLLGNERRLYRPETRGCGGSPVPPEDYVYTVDGIMADFVRLLDHFEIEKIHYIGEATGGLYGLRLALYAPDRLASISLMDSPMTPPAETRRVLSLDMPSSADAMMKYGVKEWSRRTIGSRLDAEKAGPEFVEWVTDQMGRTPDRVAASISRALGTLDVTDALPSINVPVLLLRGDPWTIGGEARTAQQFVMAEKLPDARAKLIPGYKGAIHLLAPEICVAEVCQFWSEIEG